jgi:hypothetical protein
VHPHAIPRGAVHAMVALLIMAMMGPGSVSAQETGSPSPSGSAGSESSTSEGGLPFCLDTREPRAPDEFEPCPLAPGTYAPNTLLIPMTFELDEGWLNWRSYPRGWSLVDEAFVDDLTLVIGPFESLAGSRLETADEMISSLTAHEALEASRPVDMMVGGRLATVVDVLAIADTNSLFWPAAEGPEQTPESDLPPSVRPVSPFLDEGVSARFIMLDMDGALVVFKVEGAMLEGHGEPSLDRAIEATRAILGSVRWGN